MACAQSALRPLNWSLVCICATASNRRQSNARPAALINDMSATNMTAMMAAVATRVAGRRIRFALRSPRAIVAASNA